MKLPSEEELNDMWSRHHAEWRDSAQISSQWEEAASIDPRLLQYQAEGNWWETLAENRLTLLITREYEHLVIALGCGESGPNITYLRLPHPSGLVVDRARNTIYIASTRNPNQVYDLQPVTGSLSRLDMDSPKLSASELPLIPVRSRFLPGCFYIHDLALINGELYANSVGQNAVVRIANDGQAEKVWWPLCIESENGPVFGQNYIQLNSIAAGSTLENSYFSASADRLSTRRPGHKNFPVDKRGVIFSGLSRQVVGKGLTRPHSARLHNEQVWVDNSGYGELGLGIGNFEPVIRLPGWTRGLCFYGDIAFVGTSRVIPRFRQYAPGLDVDASLCGVHAFELSSGRILGSLYWPYGNQIFAIDWAQSQNISGFPFVAGTKRATTREKKLFYSFQIKL
jgi:uncharacterized protein (TIGR03032 family)